MLNPKYIYIFWSLNIWSDLKQVGIYALVKFIPK